MRRALTLIVVTNLACNGFGLDEFDAVRGPEGYPSIDRYEGGTAELVVGGIAVRDTAFSPAIEDLTGADQNRLRVYASFDKLTLSFHHATVGEYTVAAGELEAEWDETERFTADAECGTGTLTVVGTDDISSRADRLMWGSVQLAPCLSDGAPAPEISGRFTLLYSQRD